MSMQQPSQQPMPGERVEHVAVERAPVPQDGRYNFRAAAVVGLIVGVVDVLIGGSFLLKLFGASDQSSFVGLIYAVSTPLIMPFHGIFADSGSKSNVFEPAALVAMIVYALIGWGVVVLIRITTAPSGSKPAAS
jgi:thiamine transporter ThiT